MIIDLSPQLLKFVNKSPNPNPEYAKAGDSGFDLRAWVQFGVDTQCTDKEGNPVIELKPGCQQLIHTGLYFILPHCTELQVRARSGLALKGGITVRNGIGTIDEGYRNEVGVILANHGTETLIIHNGDRIAQAALCPVYNSHLVKLEQVDEVPADTERGLGGFGHSGAK